MKRIVAALLCLTLGAWSYGGTQDPINVWAYLSAAEQADVKSCGRATDPTAHINNAIAALNATSGAQLYFPSGCYHGACHFTTITVPALISGAGPAEYNNTTAPTRGGTLIECTSTNSAVFTVTSNALTVRDIAIDDVSGAAASGSSAILVNSAQSWQHTFIENVSTFGFYDTFDIRQVEGSKIKADMWGCVHWCLHIQNTVTADEGDFEVSGNFYAAGGAPAAIRWDSGGGGKFISVKAIANNGHITDGIDVNFASSEQMLFEQIDIEGVTGIPLNILGGRPFMTVVGSYLNSQSAVGNSPAIACTNCSYGSFSGNTLAGNGGPAVSFTNSNNMTLCGNQLNGFVSLVSGGTTITTCNTTTQ